MEGDQALLPLDDPPAPVQSPREPSNPAPKAENKTVILTAISRSVPGNPFPRVVARIRKAFRVQHAMPCVGLVVLAGCLTFVIAPDEEPTVESRINTVLSASLPTIVIDPGHGGRDAGAHAHGLTEKDLTLDVGFRVRRLLHGFGFKTAMTRTGDTYLSLAERVAFANQVDNSFFVSLHFDKSPNTAASGVETFYATAKVAPEGAWTWVGYFSDPHRATDADNGETFAGYVQTALATRTNAVNRGIRGRELYVVRHTRSPAVLVEGGFISNPFDASLLAMPEYRERLAASIVEGVVQYHKAQPRPKRPTELAKATP